MSDVDLVALASVVLESCWRDCQENDRRCDRIGPLHGRRLGLSSRVHTTSGGLRVKVFISSVGAFLKEERNALPAFLQVADHEPLRFEDFTAQDRSSREACLAGVDAADVYVLLLGPKYGTPLPDSDRAPTAEEFTRARQRGIPILVFNKDVDEPDEPAQAEFKQEVGHYVNGRFWKSFTDPMSCNLAVLQALRELEAVTGPLERRTPTEEMQVPWLSDIAGADERGYPIFGNFGFGGGRGLVPSAVYAPILELHVVPDGRATPQRSLRYMAEVARAMARAAREIQFVSEGEQLIVGSSDGFAWAVRPPELASRAMFDGAETDAFKGMVASRAGAAGAFKALPVDSMGTLVDERSLQKDLAHLFSLAAPHVAKAEWVSIAAGLVNPERVYEGDPARMGSRHSGPMRTSSADRVVRVGGDFIVPWPGVRNAFGNIGADLAHEILVDLGHLR